MRSAGLGSCSRCQPRAAFPRGCSLPCRACLAAPARLPYAACLPAGLVLNNEMGDFSQPGRANNYGLHPAEANYIAPFKRPLSSMSPIIVFRRRGHRSS